MNRRIDLVLSSIGKKELMALTGLGFLAFLVVHLAGNFTIWGGAAAFDGYAQKLESLGPLVLVAEAGMVTMALVHVITGVALIVRNRRSKGKYEGQKRWAGGQTLGSYSMWLTGPWILFFVCIHLAHFTFPHKLGGDERPLSLMMVERFADPLWVAFYAVSVAAIGFHVSHGFWSALQTLGLAPSRKGWVRDLSVGLGMVCALGFAVLVIVVHFNPALLSQ